MKKTLLLLLFLIVNSFAQQHILKSDFYNNEVKVGIYSSPPFAIKKSNETWNGLAVNIWDELSKQEAIEYKYSEYNSLEDTLEALKNSEIDMIVGGTAIDSDIENFANFSLPFYSSNIVVASLPNNIGLFDNFVEHITSSKALLYFLALIVIVILFSFIVYFRERKHSGELLDKEKGWLTNIGNSMIFGVLLITSQEGDVFKLSTIFGRLIALVLILVGMVTFSGFIALLSSSITVSKVSTHVVKKVGLDALRLATIDGSRSQEYCINNIITSKTINTYKEGIEALNRDDIDAIVGGKVELHYEASLFKLPLSYSKIPNVTLFYAFAFRDDFVGLKNFNNKLTKIMDDHEYPTKVLRYTHID